MLEIQVIDSGIGIKKEDMNKLFKLFGFLDTTKELNTKGIGLGLHITKKICQALGGDIFCESEWEKGSTFTILIALDELN
jgi:Amt family ammonium transporter